MPVIPELKKLRLEDHKLKASLGYIASKQNKQNPTGY
jgi:hypothetical protein